MSELQKIRIKLKAYDHALLDQSAAKDRRDCQEDRRRSFGTDSASDRKGSRYDPESCTQVQGLQRAVRTENSQETDRHHQRYAQRQQTR